MFANADGGHVMVTDEAFGIGFATIAPYTGELCPSPFGGEDLAYASALTLTMSVALTLITLY